MLNPLFEEHVKAILQKAVTDRERGLYSLEGPLPVDEDVLDYLARICEGDARRALNGLELCLSLARSQKAESISIDIAKEATTSASLSYDRMGEEHYNQISTFIKSMRGSNPDAALYWMVRMLEAGEDPLFIIRRMIIFASEDVGNADTQALAVAVNVLHAFSAVGLPEGKIPMAQAVTYLATAPKSNASYKALGEVTDEVRKSGSLPPPLHLRNAPTGLMANLGYGQEYKYPHHYPEHFVKEQYLPDDIKDKTFYEPTDMGDEKKIKARLEKWRNWPEEDQNEQKTDPKARPSEKYEKKGKSKG